MPPLYGSVSFEDLQTSGGKGPAAPLREVYAVISHGDVPVPGIGEASTQLPGRLRQHWANESSMSCWLGAHLRIFAWYVCRYPYWTKNLADIESGSQDHPYNGWS